MLVIQGAKMFGTPDAYRALLDAMCAVGVQVALNECELLPFPDDRAPVVVEVVSPDDPPF